MFRSIKFGSLIGLCAVLSGCTPSGQQLIKASLGNVEIPLWSMPIGCGGGIQMGDGRVTLIERDNLVGNRLQMLDLSNGRVLSNSEPAKVERISVDTQVEITGQGVKPLQDSLVKSITPRGFDPVVVTNTFVFAKRAWWEFSYFDGPRQIHHGQVVVVDRSNHTVVWQLNGVDMSIQASPTHILVCDAKNISVFLPNATRPQEITNFYAAIRRGDTKMVAKLFEAWKSIPLYDLDGQDPLTVAAREGQLAATKQLLALKLSPNIQSADGYSPLLMALNQDHPEIVSLLLDAGADPNYGPYEWCPPLDRAAESASRSTINSLLKSGARMNTVCRWGGQTALHEAVMYRNYEAVQALLEAGADPHIKDKNGKTPVQMAESDECIAHLFAGGKISDKPIACASPKRESITVDTNSLHMLH